jgi:hypothetical protein
MPRLKLDWRAVLAAAAVLIAVIGGSIGLVRYQNRDRGATNAVLWALESMASVPDSLIVTAYRPAVYYAATRRLTEAIRDHDISVDSVRAFYEEYVMWARDGIITADELRAFGPFIGIDPYSPIESPDTLGTDTLPLPESNAP